VTGLTKRRRPDYIAYLSVKMPERCPSAALVHEEDKTIT
jgi:hypothetical protein